MGIETMPPAKEMLTVPTPEAFAAGKIPLLAALPQVALLGALAYFGGKAVRKIGNGIMGNP